MGGGDLPDRVAGEQLGLQAALQAGPGQGYLDREEGRLGIGGVSEAAFAPLALGEEDLLEGGAEVGVKRLTDRVQGGFEVGVCRVSSLPIAGRWEPWPVSRQASFPSVALALAMVPVCSPCRPCL